LVRTRRYVQKFYQMKTQLQGVSLRIQVIISYSSIIFLRKYKTMRSNQAMADAMKGVTKAMKGMNSRINLPAIQKIM
jgi:charged multivesicular body protein 2A